jgi:hypothetical protein
MNKKDILRAAHGLAKDAYGAAGHADAKDHLAAQFPEVEWDEIVTAYMRACELVEAAEELGNKWHKGEVTEQEAEASLAREFADFSEETLSKALSFGFFVTR